MIKEIVEAISTLEKLREKPLNEIVKDKVLSAAILWYLYVAVQGCIDLAFKIVSKLELETPESYADAFRVLRENNFINETLCDSLVKMARFRHILAHRYSRIDLKIVYSILHKDLEDIKQFVSVVIKKLEEKGFKIEDF